MIETIKNPSYSKFINLLNESEHEVILCAPYIKKNIVQKILEAKKETAKLTMITKSSLPNFISKSSDIDAVELLIENNIEVYNYQNLHAKTYMFDNKKVMITSCNLTNGGFFHNYEYGVLISEDATVKIIIDDFLGMLIDEEACGQIKKAEVKYVKEYLRKYRKKQKLYYDENGEPALEIKNINQISGLFKSKWQKDVFEIIYSIEKREFTLQEILQRKQQLAGKHPRNHNIEAKIRQQLQIIRDKGLILFVERGKYRKVW